MFNPTKDTFPRPPARPDRKAFADNVQTVWDATSLNTWLECPRKYYYRIWLEKAPRAVSIHLLFGGAYASALEHFYKKRAEGASYEEALLHVVRLALQISWAHRAVYDADKAKTRPALIRTIVWYLEEFEKSPDISAPTVHLKDGRPAVELSFQLPITDTITLAGHLDRVVEFAGATFVMDQKTTGSTITPRYFDQFNPHTQMSLYSFASKAIFKMPAKGVIIDAAQIAVNFSRFQRGFTYRTEEQLEEWLGETLLHIERAQEMQHEGVFPMNPASCGNYGGCPFRRICSADPRTRHLEENMLEVSEWDPATPRE